MHDIETHAIEVIQSMGFIRHPTKLGFWVEPYREVLIRHRNLLRWARESEDLRKRIIDEIGRLLGKRAHERNPDSVDLSALNPAYPAWETRLHFWGPLASADDGRGGVWGHPMDWGSPAWEKMMRAHYKEIAKVWQQYGFETCPKCGTQHTGITLCCRNCNHCNRPTKNPAYRRNVGMGMGMGLYQHQKWDPTGGATNSLYRKSEKYLMSNTKVQVALDRLADDDETNPEDYQSMMDYIVCAIFPEIKPACFAFYHGEGPPMRNLISAEQVDQLDRLILTILKIVTLLEESNSSASWADIRQQIIKYFATRRITAPTKSDWAAAGEMIQKYILTKDS